MNEISILQRKNEPLQQQQKEEDWKSEMLDILKSKKSLKLFAILLSVVVLRIGFNYWLNRNIALGNKSVVIANLKLVQLDKTLNLPGNVEAIQQATIFAHVSGYLKKILVDEGDKVRKDQLLAIIDAPDVVQEFRNAKAEFDFKEVTRKRYEQLLSEKVISQQEYDRVNAEANQSKARFDNADANQNYTEVRAPFKGSIARRLKYPGDFISAPTKGGPPSPLFILVNEDQLRIAVNAPQKEMSNITLGHTVDIRVDTFPNETFTGVISRIDALLDEATKTQRILIDIPNPKTKLRAGMFASVVLHTQKKNDVSMINKEAVHENGDQKFIFIVRNGTTKKLNVQTGDEKDSLIEINSPELTLKDQIIVSGGHSIADGEKVSVTSEAPRN